MSQNGSASKESGWIENSQIWDNIWQMEANKNNEKCFLFHLKSSYASQDIQIFVMTYWSCKKRLIIKVRLISTFIRWQPGKQRTEIHILFNISRSKVNQTIKFGQSIETFFMKNIPKIRWRNYCSKKSKLSLSLSQ